MRSTPAVAGTADVESTPPSAGSAGAVGERIASGAAAATATWTRQDHGAWDAVRASFLECMREAERAGVTRERACQIARELFSARRAG